MPMEWTTPLIMDTPPASCRKWISCLWSGLSKDTWESSDVTSGQSGSAAAPSRPHQISTISARQRQHCWSDGREVPGGLPATSYKLAVISGGVGRQRRPGSWQRADRHMTAISAVSPVMDI